MFLMFIRLYCHQDGKYHTEKNKLSSIWWNSKFYSHVYNCRSVAVILSQKKKNLSPFNFSSKIHFNFILPRSSLHSAPYHVSCLSHALDVIILLIIAMNAIMNFLVMYFPPSFSCFSPLKSNYSSLYSSTFTSVKDQVWNP